MLMSYLNFSIQSAYKNAGDMLKQCHKCHEQHDKGLNLALIRKLKQWYAHMWEKIMICDF